MQKKRIVFRADGNNKIGLGHMIRSLSLASILKDKFKCIFITQNPSDYLKEEIKKECTNYFILPETINYKQEVKEISKKYIQKK